MGSLKSEKPTCPLRLTTTESKKTRPLPSSDQVEQIINSLTPSTIKFEVEEDGTNVGGGDHVDQLIQYSPDDDSSSWEAFFSEIVEGDFMIQSPIRNVNNIPPSSSPSQASSKYSNNYNYNHVHSMLGGHSLSGSSSGSSPPRTACQYFSTNKVKGLSPLQRVFNSPNNQYMMKPESLSLPALERFFDDDNDDDDYISYSNSNSNSAMKSSGGGGGGNINGSSSEIFETLTTVPALLDCLTLPNSSRFCGTSSSVISDNSVINSQGVINISTTEESDIYNQMGPSTGNINGTALPLSQQLEHERQQEKHQSFNHTLVLPLSITPAVQEQDSNEDSGLQLVHLLLGCAEAVAKEDYMLARRYLHHLNRVVTPLGDSMQRVASCFTEALSTRLASTLTTKPTTSSNIINPKPFTPFPSNSLEILKIYQILYQACPYIKFAHFTANQAIFEAFEAEERVHVIDLDILQGYQWPAFMQALAARPGGPPFLRITGIGSSPDSVRETGRCLTELAHNLHVPFEFHPVGEELENLKPHMFNRRVGEALAVNSVNRLHLVPPNCLGNILAMVRDQAPNIVTIVEQEASHNGPYFLGRFLEALHYYSAIFDSLDATFPPDSAQRAKVEQYIFAPEILNIVAREGVERVVRHERLEKWRKLMEGKGFKGVALSANAVTQSKILLGLYSCDGYRLTEDKDCLLLGWQDRAILAASAWRC